MKPIFVPATEGFAMLGIGRSKGYELVKEGKLTLVKIGAKSLLEVQEIEARAAEIAATARKAA